MVIMFDPQPPAADTMPLPPPSEIPNAPPSMHAVPPERRGDSTESGMAPPSPGETVHSSPAVALRRVVEGTAAPGAVVPARGASAGPYHTRPDCAHTTPPRPGSCWHDRSRNRPVPRAQPPDTGDTDPAPCAGNT